MNPNKTFKFSDFFPIRKGDLAKITEEANVAFKRNWYDPDNAGHNAPDHDLYGKTLIVLTDPIQDPEHDDDYFGVFVQVLVQEDAEYEVVEVKDIQRIIIP